MLSPVERKNGCQLAEQAEDASPYGVQCREEHQGPRVHDWAAVEIRPLREPGKGCWILTRRSVANPEELADYVCYGPAGTALEELVQVAGKLWTIKECFEEAKGQVGLDQYEVRKWDGWYRHTTLAMLAHACLTVIRRQAMEQGEKGATTAPMKT